MFELLEKTQRLQLVLCTTTNVRFLSEDLDFKPRYGECRCLLHGQGLCVEMFRLQINRHMIPRRRRSICHWPSLWLFFVRVTKKIKKPVAAAAAATAVEHSLSPLSESYYVNYSLIGLALALVLLGLELLGLLDLSLVGLGLWAGCRCHRGIGLKINC